MEKETDYNYCFLLGKFESDAYFIWLNKRIKFLFMAIAHNTNVKLYYSSFKILMFLVTWRRNR